MLTDEEIEEIVRDKITADEKPGEQTGGSGHKGYVSFELTEHSAKPLDGGATEVTYSYTVSVETEFTYYPDNPPMETRVRKRLVLDADGKIVVEEDLETDSAPPFALPEDFAWDQAQAEILALLSSILERIEREYGENRAPFKMPPTFSREPQENDTEYSCVIELDLAGDGELTFSSHDPDELASQVREDLTRRFASETVE